MCVCLYIYIYGFPINAQRKGTARKGGDTGGSKLLLNSNVDSNSNWLKLATLSIQPYSVPYIVKHTSESNGEL